MMPKEDLFPGEQIKIVCRIRPFLAHETEKAAVFVNDAHTITLENKKDPTKQFAYSNFSSCYSSTATQVEILAHDVRPLNDRVFDGYDATIFAYGVTGSGKTFTMEGIKQEPGIIPNVVDFLFARKLVCPTIQITMSYMQILKETVYDMLNKPLDIREDSDRNIFVANLIERQIDTYDDFQKQFYAANKSRSTARANLNATSSRSHAILTFKVKTSHHGLSETGQQQDFMTTGKINLIDLAGSEDNRRSGNGKLRMVESTAINKSLFVLGQVVEALNSGSIRVPSRDSKMTRILQSSLGGNAPAMMIVNLAPGYSLINDTANTLNFAHRTRILRNTPKVNVRRSIRPPVPSTRRWGIVQPATKAIHQNAQQNRPPPRSLEPAHSSKKLCGQHPSIVTHNNKRTSFISASTTPTLKKSRYLLSSKPPMKYTNSRSPTWIPPSLSPTCPARTMNQYHTNPESPSIVGIGRSPKSTLLKRTTSATAVSPSLSSLPLPPPLQQRLAHPYTGHNLDEETITITRTELNKMREKWMLLGKQELLSSMYESQ